MPSVTTAFNVIGINKTRERRTFTLSSLHVQIRLLVTAKEAQLSRRWIGELGQTKLSLSSHSNPAPGGACEYCKK